MAYVIWELPGSSAHYVEIGCNEYNLVSLPLLKKTRLKGVGKILVRSLPGSQEWDEVASGISLYSNKATNAFLEKKKRNVLCDPLPLWQDIF